MIDSRASDDAFSIRRRRECLECGRRYTTYENVEEAMLRIVKKDGSRQPFDRKKVLLGVMKACEKRPVSTQQLEELVDRVERRCNEKFDREVDSRAVGAFVVEELRKLDQVAYVRFASVYHEFKDVAQFLEELKPFLEKRDGTEKRDDGPPRGNHQDRVVGEKSVDRNATIRKGGKEDGSA